jgi:hypothetical protein
LQFLADLFWEMFGCLIQCFLNGVSEGQSISAAMTLYNNPIKAGETGSIVTSRINPPVKSLQDGE